MRVVRYKYWGRVVFISIFVVIFSIVYFLFSPEDSLYFPKCMFHSLTGWDCPGCGSQRAVHHLLHLRVKEAFFYNPLLICAIPYILAASYFDYWGGRERFPKAAKAMFGTIAIYILLCIVALFWILRNVLPITYCES